MENIDYDTEIERMYHPENFEDEVEGQDYEPDPDLYLEDDL